MLTVLRIKLIAKIVVRMTMSCSEIKLKLKRALVIMWYRKKMVMVLLWEEYLNLPTSPKSMSLQLRRTRLRVTAASPHL